MDRAYPLAQVSGSILSPPGFSSHLVLRHKVLLLWCHNDCQVTANGMVSWGNAQAEP
ncbi:hypothetical protein Hanom_Chr02g00143031 [Helianthus anomalus]